MELFSIRIQRTFQLVSTVLVLFYSFFLSGTQQYQVKVHQPGVHGLHG